MLSSSSSSSSVREIEISAAVTGRRSSFKRFASHGYNDSTHQTSKCCFCFCVCVFFFFKSVQIVAHAAAGRMSNNRHQEIKNKSLHILQKKNKRHIVFQLFLESPWNVQNAFSFFLKIRICYITCTKIMLCVFSSSHNSFSVFFF